MACTLLWNIQGWLHSWQTFCYPWPPFCLPLFLCASISTTYMFLIELVYLFELIYSAHILCITNFVKENRNRGKRCVHQKYIWTYLAKHSFPGEMYAGIHWKGSSRALCCRGGGGGLPSHAQNEPRHGQRATQLHPCTPLSHWWVGLSWPWLFCWPCDMKWMGQWPTQSKKN